MAVIFDTCLTINYIYVFGTENLKLFRMLKNFFVMTVGGALCSIQIIIHITTTCMSFLYYNSMKYLSKYLSSLIFFVL